MHFIHTRRTHFFESPQQQGRLSTALKVMPLFVVFSFKSHWAVQTCDKNPLSESAKKQGPSEGRVGGRCSLEELLFTSLASHPGRFAGIRARVYRLSPEHAGSLPKACLPSHTAALSVLQLESFRPKRNHKRDSVELPVQSPHLHCKNVLLDV